MEKRSPHLLINPEQVRQNIRKQTELLAAHDIAFQPHMKTHQSASVAEWFRPYTDRITVSSPAMAAYFASHGWKQIFLAFPVSRHELELLRDGSVLSPGFSILTDRAPGKELIPFLEDAKVYIDVDCGYRRTGIPWNDEEQLIRTKEVLVSAGIDLRGIYTHFGDHYRTISEQERKELISLNMGRFRSVRKLIGGSRIEMCLGDTPSGRDPAFLAGSTSYHGGNFVFNDMQQVTLGGCQEQDIAIGLATRVISVYPERRECLVRAGAVHLSKDSYQRTGGQNAFGEVYELRDGFADMEHPVGYLHSISQEHGIVRLTKDDPRPGLEVVILPAHSCLTAAIYDQYFTSDGRIVPKFR